LTDTPDEPTSAVFSLSDPECMDVDVMSPDLSLSLLADDDVNEVLVRGVIGINLNATHNTTNNSNNSNSSNHANNSNHNAFSNILCDHGHSPLNKLGNMNCALNSNNNSNNSNDYHQDKFSNFVNEITSDAFDCVRPRSTRTAAVRQKQLTPARQRVAGGGVEHVRSKRAMCFRDTSRLIQDSPIEEDEEMPCVARAGRAHTQRTPKARDNFWYQATNRFEFEEEETDEEEEEEEEEEKVVILKNKKKRKVGHKRADRLKRVANNNSHNNNSHNNNNSNNSSARYDKSKKKRAKQNGVRDKRRGTRASAKNGRLSPIRQPKLITEAVDLRKNATYTYERKLTQYVSTTRPIFENRYNKTEREAFWYA
jgi:hypothetical protein